VKPEFLWDPDEPRDADTHIRFMREVLGLTPKTDPSECTLKWQKNSRFTWEEIKYAFETYYALIDEHLCDIKEERKIWLMGLGHFKRLRLSLKSNPKKFELTYLEMLTLREFYLYAMGVIKRKPSKK